MRKTCLAGAIALALSGAQGALAEEAAPQAAPEAPAAAAAPAAPAPEAPEAAAPVEPTAPAAAAPGPENLRAMTPAERREHFKQEHEKFRAAAEAAAPPSPPPLPEPPGMQGMPEPPDIAERTAAMEKLRSMTPEERRAAIKEAHMRMKEQIQAMSPAAPPPPAAPEAAGPSGEMAQLKGMTPEERSAFRAQRYQELRDRAAALGLDLPESPPWEGHRRLTQEEIADYKARMRKITPEDREAYREEHYQKLRERARAAGLELPDAPPWKGPGGPAGPSHPSTAEIDRLHQEMVKLRTEMRDEIRNMYDRLGAMSPEDRQAILDLYQPQIDEKWQQMARAMDQWQPPPPPRMGYGGEPPYGPGAPGAGYGPGPYQGQGGPMPPYPPRDYGYGPGGGGYGPGYGPGGGYGYGR